MAAYTTIDNPELYFQVKLYTGNGTDDTSITLDGEEDMQPDMIWFNCRSHAEARVIHDSPRGIHERLFPGAEDAEGTATNALQSFNSNGWTMGVNDQLNSNTKTYVAWCWNTQGGAGSSNTDGGINTTTTSVNTTSKFSISTFTGTGSASTIGHGLGVAPNMLIVKRRESESWQTLHMGISGEAEKYMTLHSNAAVVDSATSWNDTDPTSTVFSVGTSNSTNASSGTYVAYCWADVQGYSKFGQYEGNGNADGTFVYTGFRPAWIMTKSIDSTSEWHIFDDQREGYNVDNDALTPEGATELTTDMIDILSNGFKCRIATDPNVAETYVYAAFAKAPLVNSEGVPCNAR